MRVTDCHNFHDFRELARRRLPAPIFNYIDGAADDEVTYRRNTASFEQCDLVPNVLRGVDGVDLSVTVMGQRLAMPVYCSPTALQRLFHHERFSLPQLAEHIDFRGDAMSIGRYFTEMLDPSITWDDVAQMVRDWDGQFCLKGIMSVEDARQAAAIGCTGIVLSNHGGRQLDGSRSAFDQLAEVVDAVGDRLDVMMDGGIQRGTHVLKAIALGAKAVGIGRFYLFPLAAAGRAGVERALGLMQAELVRGLELMGCTSPSELSRSSVRFH